MPGLVSGLQPHLRPPRSLYRCEPSQRRPGCIIICDENGVIVSDRDGHEGESIDLLGYAGREEFREGVCFTDTIYGASSYCMFAQTEGYYIIAVLAVSEAMFSRDVAVYILAFMETLVFAVLFAQIYFLVKKLVVENIQKINHSLSQITGRDLMTAK